MKDLLVLLAYLLTTIAKLLGPGGARAIVADSLLMKQQLLVINRSRRRAPNLSALDRFLFGFWSLFLSPLHYHPHPDDNGPSWLAFIGHAKDSLWSIDLFRCESILLKTHWAVLQSTT